MKKLIGVMLALMIAVTGIALAENAAKPVETAEGYLLVSIDGANGETRALIGSGDGEDVFDAFTSIEDTYAERFDAFWKLMSMLQPALSLEGSIENMSFEPSLDNSRTAVTLNGVVVAQLEGLETFAFVSGKELPVVKEGCDVLVWAHGSVAATVCLNCGEPDDGSAKHSKVISAFCDEKHTECMGDPIHHCDECGKDYVCSKSNSHTECTVCGKPWCYKDEGNHAELECGHRGCEIYGAEDEHALCETCGEYLCNGKEHEHPEELPEVEEPDSEPDSEITEGDDSAEV